MPWCLWQITGAGNPKAVPIVALNTYFQWHQNYSAYMWPSVHLALLYLIILVSPSYKDTVHLWKKNICAQSKAPKIIRRRKAFRYFIWINNARQIFWKSVDNRTSKMFYGNSVQVTWVISKISRKLSCIKSFYTDFVLSKCHL